MNTHLTSTEETTLTRLLTPGTWGADDEQRTTARIIRERANLTACDMAARVGVATRTLRAWEEGLCTPRQPYAAHKYLLELQKASEEIVARVEANRAKGIR